MRKDSMSVLATYTSDILINEVGEVLTTQPGGPALFIKKALNNESVKYEDFEQDQLTVKILLTKSGEFGKILKKPRITNTDALPLSDWAVISTVLDEWDISSLKKFPKRLFVDLQGYVRDGKYFGKKQNWEDIEKIYHQIFCIKGTRKEISYLPAKVINNQKKNRMLVVTDGPRGTEIFSQGEEYYIPTQPVRGLKDTIGAGDTFLGYFVASLYKGMGIEKSGQYATNKTRTFLLDKGDGY